VVAEAGARDDRHRLIAVYQGILLSSARRVLRPLAAGEIDYVLSRYEEGTVILRPLRTTTMSWCRCGRDRTWAPACAAPRRPGCG
jgi:hypothetical protein